MFEYAALGVCVTLGDRELLEVGDDVPLCERVVLIDGVRVCEAVRVADTVPDPDRVRELLRVVVCVPVPETEPVLVPVVDAVCDCDCDGDELDDWLAERDADWLALPDSLVESEGVRVCDELPDCDTVLVPVPLRDWVRELDVVNDDVRLMVLVRVTEAVAVCDDVSVRLGEAVYVALCVALRVRV